MRKTLALFAITASLSSATLACRAHSVAAEPPPPDPKVADASQALELPAYLVPIFEADSEWRFSVTTSTGFWDDQHPDADDNGMVRASQTSIVTCRVAERRDYGKTAVASHIECDGDADLEPLAGVWVVTESGLHRVHELPDDVDALRGADPFLSAEPAAVERSEENDEGHGSYYNSVLAPGGDGWCVKRSWYGGDEAGEDLCLTVDGPQAGGKWWAGGSDMETTFERVVETARGSTVKPFAVDAYAAWLFDTDAEWTFDVTRLNAFWDDQDPAANADGMVESKSTTQVTCRVAEVRHFGADGVASRITCDDADADLRPLTHGIWMATTDGLTRRELSPDVALPSDAAQLAEHLERGTRFLSSTPKKVTESSTNGDGHTSTYATSRPPGAEGWCVEHTFVGGDESFVELCLTERGPVAGGHGWSGGSVNETRYQLAD